MVYMFFNRKSSGSGIPAPNYQLANELHRQIIRKFKNQKSTRPSETVFGVWT